MDDTDGGDGQVPHGKLLLLNDTSGSPDDSDVLHSQALESHSSIAALIDGTDWAGWLDYSISPDIILPKGTYWFALNDTKDGGAGSWNWQTVDDSGQIDSGAVNFKFSHGASWTPYSGKDVVMMPKVIPVEDISSSYPAKEYTDPAALDFKYKTSIDTTTTMSTFSMFEGNMTSDNIHSFSVNTSVNFVFSWWIEVNYTNNPITPSSYYKAMNNTDIAWNITFNHAQVSTSYQVRNHTLVVSGFPSDWNGTEIYWNDSSSPEYPNLTNDINVTWDDDPTHKYTYGNTTMVVNASTLAVNTTWYVWFVAPNYLSSFNLSRGGQFLDLPYEANVTDTLGLNIQVLESGGNASYWIEDFNNQAIHKRTDFSSADFTDLWNIDDNVSQTTNVNGTYDLQAFWISSDKTKVGTITRDLDVIINTTLTINSTDTIDVLIGDKINIWANYTSNHNSTINSPSHIDKAKIWCNASWPDGVKQNVSMNQPIGTYYNASFTTTNEDPGTSGTITIITQLPWFVNQSKTLTINFVGKTDIAANQTNIDLKWRENTTL
jgi:hypothetical protein